MILFPFHYLLSTISYIKMNWSFNSTQTNKQTLENLWLLLISSLHWWVSQWLWGSVADGGFPVRWYGCLLNVTCVASVILVQHNVTWINCRLIIFWETKDGYCYYLDQNLKCHENNSKEASHRKGRSEKLILLFKGLFNNLVPGWSTQPRSLGLQTHLRSNWDHKL